MVPETSPETEESVNTDPQIRARCDTPVCVDMHTVRTREGGFVTETREVSVSSAPRSGL